jgi:hypothetical protein
VLSAKESLIFDLLIERTSMYGLELVSASRGRLKRGTVYVTLGRMEDKGYITSRTEPAPADEGGLPRGSTSPRPWVAEYRRHGRPLPRISRRVCTMTRPGFRLCAFAARVCSARTMERWIDPLIADLHSEHAEMQRRGSLWRARSVRVVSLVAFGKVLALAGVGEMVARIHRDPGGDCPSYGDHLRRGDCRVDRLLPLRPAVSDRYSEPARGPSLLLARAGHRDSLRRSSQR